MFRLANPSFCDSDPSSIDSHFTTKTCVFYSVSLLLARVRSLDSVMPQQLDEARQEADRGEGKHTGDAGGSRCGQGRRARDQGRAPGHRGQVGDLEAVMREILAANASTEAAAGQAGPSVESPSSRAQEGQGRGGAEPGQAGAACGPTPRGWRSRPAWRRARSWQRRGGRAAG